MWLLLLLCLFSLEPGQGAFIKHERTGRNELRARMGLLGLDQGFLPDFNHPDVDEHCKNHFNFFLQDLTSENASTWSMLMADASGKIPAGYLYGNVYSLGNFDECLKVSVNSEGGYEFLGKHCLAQIFFTGM
ncbi:unnamed protein product [Darwinula stevensoni]|uniref:Nose resistant-to-fluoxetine protein N-terminal domain-containing protein n=1 Tax=Darwinula stevensoni TaxID=69355 RepID=A0A7R8X8R3_9CRUS|nr:unnamed protein product [Darwinula stevensoni]CAG0883687.1 unnamed protein product [Darwinula stevensoni]